MTSNRRTNNVLSATIAVLLVYISCAGMVSVKASDPDPLVDVSPKANETFVFRNVLKNEDSNTTEGGTRAALDVKKFPALEHESITYVHFKLQPCRENLPHTHPRATELLTMISGGPLQVGFVDTSGTPHVYRSLSCIIVYSDPKAIIHKTIAVHNTTPAPVIPYFSSVGPNTITRDMLKPDISAPGVDILAAWAPVAYADKTGDSPYPIWKILSRTSMAAPHTAGAIALVKSAHPEWSPAAIKSAIMTTATPFNTSIPGNYELASGAGEINPNKAANPGLIFDMNTTDYINFLCAIGYNATSANLMSGRREKCPNNPPTVLDMNVPSIYISSNLTVGLVYSIVRTVTNVGPARSEYSVSVKPPMGTDVQVTPSTLQFKDVKEQQSFTVSVTMKSSIRGYNFGSITWNENNKDHSVGMVIGAGYNF